MPSQGKIQQPPFPSYLLPVPQHILCCLLISCLNCTVSACGKPILVTLLAGKTAPDFTLEDQYDVEFHLSQFPEQNLLLLGCDGEGLNQRGEWLALFKRRYVNDLYIIPVFNASSLPTFARWFLKGKFKAKLRSDGENPGFPRILLDWNGKVSSQYGLHPESCTIVLIDRLGKIKLIHPLDQIDRNTVEATLNLIDRQLER